MGNFSEGVEMQNFFLRMRHEMEEAGIPSASFELRQLIAAVTGEPFYEIRLENEFTEAQLESMEAAVRRRIAGEPLQYILGEWEFLGLPIGVGPGVLIPRPETELLAGAALDYLEPLADRQPRALDLCCGSGCIAVALAKLTPHTRVTAVDLYEQPLRRTRENARRNEVELEVVQADALAAPPAGLGPFDAIVSNPPYIETRELDLLQPEVRREPREALDGGEDGLRFYRAILQHWAPLLVPGGRLFLEVGIYQAQAVAQLLREAGMREVAAQEDYAGIERVVTGTRA